MKNRFSWYYAIAMSALSAFLSIRGGLIKGREAWIAVTGIFVIAIIIVLVDFYKTRKRPSNS